MNKSLKIQRYKNLKENPELFIPKEFDRVDEELDILNKNDSNIVESVKQLDNDIKELSNKEEPSRPDIQKVSIEGAELITIKGKQGDKGDKGDKGDSIQGQKGKDGLNGKDGKNGIDGISGIGIDGKDGIDGIDGIDGKDGLEITPDQVIEKIHLSKNLIKKEKIEGFDELERKADFALQRPLVQGFGGTSGIREIKAGTGISVRNDNQIITVTNTDKGSDVDLSGYALKTRVGTEASSATPTINTDLYDEYIISALATNITSMTTNLTGTPVEGDLLWISITGTATRLISWGTGWEPSTTSLPQTTVGTNRLDMCFARNMVTSCWRILDAS